MRTFNTLALVLAASLALSACSMIGLGESEGTLKITEYGVYKNGELVMRTNGIYKTLGTTFGMRVTLVDPKGKPVKARIRTMTPGLLDPAKSEPQLEYDTATTLVPGQTYDVFFTFSQPWELAPGLWELKVETESGQSVSQTFDVYSPDM